jgi:hypothetical protein
MADIFTASSAYQGTFVVGTVETDPVYSICGAADINASNQLECSFWIKKNGELIDSDLGTASYLLRDKNGTAVSGLTQTGMTADANGYYHSTAVSAALIYDLTHFVIEVVISVDGEARKSALGFGIGG